MSRILFAPGAGAPSTSPWMEAWAARLARLGRVVRLDYPYRKAGRRRPDPLPRLIAAHAAALDDLGPPALLAGKSMGSRVGCHLAVERPADVLGLVCLGYPLVGQSGKRRDEVLLALRAPVLFVQGTRDRLCPLDLLAEVRTKMSAPSALHVVETGDHDLRITKRHEREARTTQAASDAAVLAAIERFVSGCRSG